MFCFLLAEAFYLMVGSYYYCLTRGDWVYNSAYMHMYGRAKRQGMEGAGFDEGRLEAMESYVENLENHLEIMYG